MADQSEAHLDSRGVHIQQYGPETKGDHQLVAFLQRLGGKLTAASSQLENIKRQPDGPELLATLRVEELLRKLGDGDIERGRHRREAARAKGVAMAAERRRAQPRLLMGHVLNPRLAGRFSLCPLCGLLVYRSPKNIKISDRAWHGVCWRAWQRSPAVLAWSMQRRTASRLRLPRELLSDFPLPFALSIGSLDADDLGASYRALMRSKRVMPASLAKEEGIDPSAITHRIKSVRKRLPASWDLVFNSPSGHRMNTIRQQLERLPIIGPGQQKAAQRMASIGIDNDVIMQVTGVELTAQDDGQPVR